MSETVTIRRERESDRREVEEMIRKAFWNLYVPGCAEHYLAHIMRAHPDFLPELDLVAQVEGRIVGNIMYTRSRLTDEAGEEKEILTFGPVCVLPGYQRRGYGKKLMEASFQKALALGYDAVVIFGNPGNYVSSGFKSCKKYQVSLEDGSFPTAMLVRELRPAALDGRTWVYRDSPVYHQVEEAEVERFDRQFPAMEKAWRPSQEEFYILSHSVLM